MAKAAAKKRKVAEESLVVEVQPPKVVETVFTGGMATIRWVSEALAAKDIGPAMTHYRVGGGTIRASNGRLTAAYPWPDDAEFLVSGVEFEKVLARMEGDEPTIAYDAEAQNVLVRSGRFSATIGTLPAADWAYPGVEDAEWRATPEGLLAILRSLRAFVPDNPAQAWQGCVALESGNLYATNNIALAGMSCDVGDVQALLPSYAIDFLLRREEGLEEWAWTDNYVAFRWSSGAWVRSQLVIGRFPERAASLVREAYESQPTQEITNDFREAFSHVSALAEDTIRIYGDRMEAKFKKSVVVAPCECEVPGDADASIWGAAYLAPVVSQATRWSPGLWPKPAPFRGDSVAGFIVGRKGE